MKISIEPFLSVRDGAAAVAFYKAAFGARELMLLGGGSVVAHLAVDDASFWVADESPEYKNFSPATLGGATTRMILTVDDPDAMFERAVTAGADVVSPMQDQEYGWRQGRVADPFGHNWEIGRPL